VFQSSPDSKRSRNSWQNRKLLFIVVGIAVVLGGWAIVHFHNQPEATARENEAVARVSASNTAASLPVATTPALTSSDSRWGGVLGVLRSMNEWTLANPVCHMTIATAGAGNKVYSDTEIFRFKIPDSTNLVTRVKVQVRYPNPITFLIEQQDGKILAYLPETGQLLAVDAKGELLAQYGWDLQNPDTSTFLNLLRIAFVETNANQRALTFAFKPEVLRLPAAAADNYTTLRIDDKGALQTVEQTELGEHRVMRVKYLSFDQEEVARLAPEFPADKPVITGKSFNLALQEEIIKLKEKGTLQIKI
jgi:hypothetical protein